MSDPTAGPTPRMVVESLVRHDGVVVLADAYDVANEIGIDDQPLRLAIRRLVADGAFVQEGRGRKGILRRTPGADLREQHDVDFVALAYAQDAGLAPWDGTWHLLSVSVPERDRALRDRLRRTLMRLGAGQLHSGLYVSPHDWEDLVLAECPELATIETVATATTDDLVVGGTRAPRQIAARLWPLAQVATDHRELLTASRQAAVAARPGATRASRLSAVLRLVAAFDHAHVKDPLLPRELLPEPWAGARSRQAFVESWSRLHDKEDDHEQLFTRFNRAFSDPA
ncbi:PaaX family transcriptional regulator C-terminal domain-containing protein [Nocardioides sp.]|uniref:PaaX family transcriptional regulator C-terminal domain-containing protein n=1 Tax=Nocardioides sp. TaxID=35761 RepID=UPI002BB46FFC|nr:PaaX family transcriptional regulator C-terminal domain-containing protein [Nocardioides sp.]HXH81042.1 PaaX family transcriptional regulator C-terminal domain-containing protein [Nocardioides sp.]